MDQPQSILSASHSSLTQIETPEIIFETVVAEAIDDVLSGLGDVYKKAIYRHLKDNYGINKNEIPYKIEDFARAIEETFGSVATLIEIKIIERLHAKYKNFVYTPEKGELNFVKFIYNLKHHSEFEN